MTIGFVLPRSNHFRLHYPMVEEALRRGFRVILYHLYWGDRFALGKSMEFPVLSACQGYEHAGAELRMVRSPEAFREILRADAPDWVISLQWASSFKIDLAQERYRWGVTQVGIDLFTFPVTVTDIERSVLFVRSKRWLELGIPHAMEDLLRTHRERLLRDGVEIGYLALQDHARFDAKAIGRKYGLDEKARYLLFLPFPVGGFDTRVGTKERVYLRYYYDRRMKATAPWEANLLRKLNFEPTSMYDTWQDVRRFADRLGMIPLVKGRFKKEMQAYFEEEALVFYDETYAPSTTHELLHRADLCVSHLSLVNFEASYAGTYSLNFSWPFNLASYLPTYRAMLGTEAVSGFEWKGVTSTVRSSTSLAQLSVEDVTLEPKSVLNFHEWYDAGIEDGLDRVFHTLSAAR